MKRRAGTVGLTAITLAGSVGCGTAATGVTEKAIEPASGAPSSKASPTRADPRLSSRDLQARWWSWAAREPEETNPVVDRDGSECGRNQPGDVWFLAGTFGTQESRACTVPEGLPVVFPLVNQVGSTEDCAAFMRTAEGSAELDGEWVEPDVHPAEPITVKGTADNPVTGWNGTVLIEGCGLWVQLPPLKPGPHSLKIRGQSGDFSVGVDYSLAVEATSD